MRGALLCVLATAAAWVHAQTTALPTPTAVPTCKTGFQWAFNSLNQSPCQIAAFLAEACVPGLTTFQIQPLQAGQVYGGPLQGQTTSCRCSSVYYSVLSACALCQGAAVTQWTQYNANCSTPFLTVFPTAIPQGVTVPHWAYLDVSSGNGQFDAAAAQAAGGVESTAVPQPTTSASATPQASGKKSHAGAIAGGVIGGIVGALLIGFLVYWLLRRRNRRQRRGPIDIIDEPRSEGATIAGDKTGPYGATPKLYDPNDPTSFPMTMAQLTGTGSTTSFPSAQGRQPGSGFTNAPSGLSRPNAQYTGAAEAM